MSGNISPAQKRNYGANKSLGKYLVFLDDDSFPNTNFLSSLLCQIELHPDYAGFCGPCLTPASNDIYQHASGLVWASLLGSGGAGTYRNSISTPRFVDDFPSVNLTIKRQIFNKIGGFNTHHWPGEDTILCLEITHNLHQKIYYHPSIIVYHHRRQVFLPHLQQIGRYALHRGNFARIYPQTSLRLGYLLPSIFTVYCLSLPFLLQLNTLYKYPLHLYLTLLVITFIQLLINNSKLLIVTLATLTIPLTHIYYGLLFIIGFVSPKLSFTAHRIDKETGKYLGG
jgi:cellulose synthase/poly-beta-1,6-N-acetylglucosamine synthase-like glycosyltransferase